MFWTEGHKPSGAKCRLLFFILACANIGTLVGQNRPPVPVRFTEARARVVGQNVRLPGSVVSVHKSEVATPVAGLVTGMRIRDGDVVEKGQILAVLGTEASEIRKEVLVAQLSEAKVRVKSANSKLNRANELFGAKLISREQFDDSRYELEALEARVRSLQQQIAQAELQLRLSTIRAPFPGVVTAKRTEVGQWLGQGDVVCDLLAGNELEVLVQVPEIYISKVEAGQRPTITFEALPGLSVPGTVVVIGAEADVDARTFPVKVAVSNRNGQIRPGMLANLKLNGIGAQASTIVPKDSIVRKDNDRSVFVIVDGNTVEQRMVSVGAGVGEWVEVSGDVQPGEKLITRGNERLRPGQLVTAERMEYTAP